MKIHLRQIKLEHSAAYSAIVTLRKNKSYSMTPGSIAEYICTYRGKEYGIAISKYAGFKGTSICYTLFNPSDFGWNKIPCMTRAEEKRYPTTPAWMGTYLVRLHTKGA